MDGIEKNASTNFELYAKNKKTTICIIIFGIFCFLRFCILPEM
jgi:hypothetical protein